ncbi:GNAT family N-acetyltransferase [Streptomyces cyaneochromogenes]|uniref:GNAT family N-acetyltransferase n=1 Tax=Streptomyces cyaneochromogenes TaxID=2496836 RepID=UPI001E44EE6D|nr:GNAT family N-acetyltransferase [Streptomyces cyaneochromogenes]
MTTYQAHPIVVRTAIEKDIPNLVECAAALFAEDAGSRDSAINTNWPREYGPDRFATGLHDPDRLILTADSQNGSAVAYLTGTLAQPSPMTTFPIATLTAMWVSPDHRGSGVGAQLVEQFLTWAKERGAERAEVTAYVANEGARRFYARHGFTDHATTAARPL